jgi:hypothetical protein
MPAHRIKKAHLFRDAPIDLPEQPKLVEILSLDRWILLSKWNEL